MQFMMKWEVDFEIGGDKAPILCDVRLGAAFDDQPTACFLGRSSEPPVRGIESGRTDTMGIGLLGSCYEKHKLF